MSAEDRSERVVRFLMGLRDPEVAVALRGHGFTEELRREGYRLLEAQTADALLAKAAPPNRSRELLSRLDVWENQWLPIAEATLRHRFPAVYDSIFALIRRGTGVDVIHSVGTFVGRLGKVREEKVEGADEAVALLVTRGFTPGVLAEARAIVDALLSGGELPPEPPVAAGELARRDQELWNYYLEWSAIARATIKDPRLLRKLGFGKSGRRRKEAGTEPTT